MTVIGAGVAGLCCALELAGRGARVEVVERGRALGEGSCSWQAGGMLAPWCERATTDAVVAERGASSIDWWSQHFPGTARNGSLVVAQPRDAADLTRFAQRTERFDWIGADRIASLEPDLAGRYRRALFFPDEAHLDPRRALAALVKRLAERGVPVRFGVELSPDAAPGDIVVDCRGLVARDVLPDLRGVRGEMVVVRCRDITLTRPVRMLHPRIPLYIVPRGEGLFMIGATMIESEQRGAASVRSTVELLNAAYALHPAFGEAEIVELGADLRPAFADNLPQVRREGRVLRANGLFRHGFLLAPALARQVADTIQMETNHADIPERRRA
ncbi:MAG: thiamine biosynthesis protein thio [Alphaproteobacteria bacterium RIFCSPHIGHO2_12_FULL_66_14]|nr:MAG: thiamine biosynthesis protein thio [Alphaproteobacteria bacterium RIFCSPHIGHO2_12_FULL_66_14]